MNITEIKDSIQVAILADDSVIIEGKHGIGKSDIAKQIANENDYHIEVLFLSHQETGDLIGIPDLIKVDNKSITIWSKPIWLQRMEEASKNGKRCLLFLDELNRATKDVRQSALQLVLEKQIHEHKLPNINGECVILSAINPSDEYQVDELDPALLDRFLTLKAEADLKSWLIWAKDNNINSAITTFLTTYPDRFCPTVDLLEGKKSPTPRSWAKLSNYIDIQNKIKPELMYDLIKGKIGEEIGSQFYAFLSDMTNILSIDNIIEFVKENDTGSVESTADLLKYELESVESIRLAELADNLSTNKTLLELLVFLYSINIEICISWIHRTRDNNRPIYDKIVKLDTELNNKTLFKRIIAQSKL